MWYVSLFWISLFCTVLYFYMWHRHFSVYFSLIFALIPIENLGYVLLSQAKSMDAVTLSIKVTYIGGCFLILFIMLNIFDMCKIKFPKWARMSAFLLSTMMFLAALTIGERTYFYKAIRIRETAEGLRVDKIYGPVHTFSYVLTAVYFLLSFGAIIYSYRKKKDVSRKIILLLFIPEAISFFLFFGGRLITDRIDFLPLGYVFAQLMYLLIAHRMCMYDISETAIDSLTETGATGFVSFDFDLNYLGSNRTATAIFEEIGELTVDKPLSESEKLEALLKPWIMSFAQDETKDKYYYSRDDHIYLIDINDLYDERVKKGYQLVITDDTKNQKYIELIDNYNADLEKEVREKTAGIINMHNKLIRGMAMLVESRDNSTGGHIVRTSDVVEILMSEIMKDRETVERLGLDDRFRERIIKAAPLHDIGKIAVDDAILKKPGHFTDEEYEKMKMHAPEGARVLHSILEDTNDEEFKKIAENVAHFHHERMDGSGYPDGRKGEEIPVEARIMAIADVYDALVSKRVYKESMSFEKADFIMMEGFGKHFDAALEKFYVAARPEIERYYQEKE